MAVIIKPLVTEKANSLQEKRNQYTFVVRPDANKTEIKGEIEHLYNVHITGISTMRYAGKNKARYTRSGLVRGRTNAFKKAIVTLKEGETIDFYSNI